MTEIDAKRKNRTKEEIIAAILDSAKNGATKTKIMYVSYMSFNQLSRYLNYVLESKLIDLDYNNSGKYYTTTKGLKYLKELQEAYSIHQNFMEKKRLLSAMLQNSDL